MTVMMIAVTSYVWYRARFREDFPKYNKWGPFYLTLVAAFLVVLDPTRQFAMDYTDSLDALSMYVDSGCESETLKCLSPVGWVFTFITWIGFTLLVIGTMWNANLMDKLRDIRDKWRELREENQEENYEQLPAK